MLRFSSSRRKEGLKTKRISITFSDKDWAAVEEAAQLRKMPVQEYIRITVLGKKDVALFSVEEAYRRACAGDFKSGKPFSLPDLYSEREWSQLPHTKAGGFGRQFFNYVRDGTKQIEFVGVVRRLAKYRYKTTSESDKED